MSKSVNNFWWKWVIVVIIGVMIFSLTLMLIPDTMQELFNILFYGSADADGRFDENASDYIQFVYGVLGAVMIGWSVSMLTTVFGAFKRGEREGWNGLALSIVVWFVVDSAFSIYAGFVENAVFNLTVFVMLAIPLGATYRAFYD
jgi:hypothetical protein